MRFVSLIAAMAALFISGAAHAQAWEEYVNRGDFFAVNFPGEPMRADITYKTAKGTSLQGHVFTAQDSRGRYASEGVYSLYWGEGRDGFDTVFTLDRRDFSVYRHSRTRRLKIIPAAH